jgi:hypothetical protein
LQRYGISPEIGGKNPEINQENFLYRLSVTIKVISNNESAQRIVHEKHEISATGFFSCLSCFSWTVGISGAVFADIKREKLLSICLVYTGMMAVLMR